MEARIIHAKTSKDGLYGHILEILPVDITRALALYDKSFTDSLTEIRLRAGAPCSVTYMGKTVVLYRNGAKNKDGLPIILTEKDIEDYIFRLCGGSVYSYEESILRGYITSAGVRNGICGELAEKCGKITGFSSVRSVNIRLPRHLPGCADGLISHIKKHGLEGGGILVASLPGVGKTTVLRELAIRLSDIVANFEPQGGPYRVTVVDERSELYIPSLFTNSCADILTGVQKHTGIELASRVMSPQVIIFDEIGSERDAEAVISAHFNGISFISSVHAASPEAVSQSRAVRSLLRENIFKYVYFLRRTESGVQGFVHSLQGASVC